MNKRWKALTVPYEVVAANSEDTQCYRLSGKTVAMLLAMIQYMEWRTRWHKDDGSELSLSEIDNVKAWAAQSAYELMTPEPCADETCEEGDCVAYLPTNPIFSYAPNNPFSACETPPAGYLTCPLRFGVSSPIPGLLPDDVVCSIDTLLPAPPLGLIDQVLNSGFPRVHMEFSGAGEIEVHLIEVVQGGLAIVRIDDVAYVNVVNLQGIALSDIRVSLDFIIDTVIGILDWKFVAEKIIEFSVPSGDHTLDILFIPNLSLNILETGWGGGLRSVVLCGDFTVTACPDTVIDPIIGGGMAGLFDLCWHDTEDGYILRWTVNGGCTWNDVGLCDGGGTVNFPEPIEVVPTSPIDNDGGVPTPEFTPETRCRAAEFGMRDMLGTVSAGNALYDFIVNVILGADAAVNSNLLIWLGNEANQAGSTTYIQYYESFKALILKWKPHKIAIENEFNSATFTDAVCAIYDCLPADANITRGVLDCIADYFQSLADGFADDSDGEKYYEFIVDYINIYPLEWVRHNVLIRSGQSTALVICPCETPPVSGCGVYTPFVWTELDISDNAGWISVADGNPQTWAHNDATFEFVNIFTFMQRYFSGWKYQQNQVEPVWAGSIEYVFDDPYELCTFYTSVTTSSYSGNTRMATAWAQTSLGVWTPLDGKRINIHKGGYINLSWSGALLVSKLKLVGVVGKGNSEFRFHNIFLNQNMA